MLSAEPLGDIGSFNVRPGDGSLNGEILDARLEAGVLRERWRRGYTIT